ncbi:hypothetical protein, partial [Flavobacterium sp. RSP49]|uniref:hypothetical protein n=2 Tax=unclassified Flavobacterium TaxID=196869 RepID=UPI001F34D6FA
QKRFCKCLIKYFYLIICIGYSGQDNDFYLLQKCDDVFLFQIEERNFLFNPEGIGFNVVQ